MFKIQTIPQKEKDWCLQRYILETELDLTKNPKVKIIKNLPIVQIKWELSRVQFDGNATIVKTKLTMNQRNGK